VVDELTEWAQGAALPSVTSEGTVFAAMLTNFG
jgi:hypothetical protein